MAEDDSERQADALNAMTGGGGDAPEPPKPPPPRSAAQFRQARPQSPVSKPQEAAPTEPAPTKPREPRPSRPAAPPAQPQAAIPSGDVAARRLGAVTSAESDTVPIYVPPPSGAAAPTTSMNPAELASKRALDRKRTFIPVLLTCGVLLVISGAARFVVADDSAFRLLSPAMSLGLLGFGALLLFVAALNMLQVRDQIAAAVPQPRV